MIGFVGLSHLGIIYSVATAAQGLDVLAYDPNAALCEELSQGRFPVLEPGLSATFSAHRNRLTFTANAKDLNRCTVVFVSLDVATDAQNQSDLGPLERLIGEFLGNLGPGAAIVLLSQVPPGFTRALGHRLAPRFQAAQVGLFYQVETLVFGNAVERALHPERFIVGCESPADPLPAAYRQWLAAFPCPVLPMRYESAELAKIAINLFLVSSVTTTNTLAELSEQLGAEWTEIAPALRLDRRIGPHAYLAPGLGLAGGNLERDLVTFRRLADECGSDAGVVAAWMANSAYRRDWVLRSLHKAVFAEQPQARLAIWGLAYKAHTHSTKNSPALALIDALPHLEKRVYDPQVRLPSLPPKLTQADSALDACAGAHALAILTPWPEFREVDLSEVRRRMAGHVVVDPFGVRDPAECATRGFHSFRLGSPAPGGLKES